VSTEDRPLSALMLTVVAALSWHVLSGPERRPADRPLPIDAFEVRVRAISEAIAVAEGYYAPGEHDGHSLPYILNNPGGLKKPALGAAVLPTWEDTGLVFFPDKEMGWAALRHQVRLMLTGASSIYEPSDTLLFVAEKYADGDVNWGLNVAATLRVSPVATLEELTVAELTVER
jgi:hypothetical protein